MTAQPSSPPVAALALADLPAGQTRAIVLSGLAILLCHDEGRIFAVENRCSHLDEPLTCGHLRFGRIVCPAHGARFDLASGAPIGPPASTALRTFPVSVIAGVIHVSLGNQDG